MSNGNPLQLIFQGPVDDAPDTLRRVKGAFISDLSLSVDEVKRILENAPQLVIESENGEHIQNCFNTLKKAGGKVTIVESQSGTSTSFCENFFRAVGAGSGIEIAADAETGADIDQELEDTENEAIEFILDLDDDFSKKPQRTADTPSKVYTLEFNPDNELKLEELGISEGITESNEGISSATEGPELKSIPSDSSQDALPLNEEGEENEEVHELENEVAVAPSLVAEENLPNSALQFALEENDEIIEQAFEAINKIKEFQNEALQDEIVAASKERQTRAESPKMSLAFESEVSSAPPIQEENEIKSEESHSTVAKTISSSDFDSPSSPLQSVFSIAEVDETTEPKEASAIEEQESGGPMVAVSTSEAELDDNDVIVEDAKQSPEQPSIQHKKKIFSITKTKEVETAQPSVFVNRKLSGSFKLGKLISGENISSQNILVALLIVILIGGNSFFLVANIISSPGRMRGISESTIDQMISSFAGRPAEPRRSAAELSGSESLSFRESRGKTSNKDVTVSWDLSLRGNKVIRGNLQINTPKPPDLTPEEIVRKTPPHPWLRRAELLNLRFAEVDTQTFRASGAARVYIEAGQTRFRTVAKAEVVLTFNAEEDHISGYVRIENDYEGDAVEDTVIITAEKSTNYKFLLHSFFGDEVKVEVPRQIVSGV